MSNEKNLVVEGIIGDYTTQLCDAIGDFDKPL